MDAELRFRAEEIVRKRINDCISPEAINEAITFITTDLYNLYFNTWVSNEKELITVESKRNVKTRRSKGESSNKETEGTVWIDCRGRETKQEQRIQEPLGIKRSVSSVVCNKTNDHNHLLCPLQDETLQSNG